MVSMRRIRHKILAVIWLALNCLCWADANMNSAGSYQMMGEYKRHVRKPAGVDIQCTHAVVRLEFCLEDVLRIRMNPSGQILPDEPWVVIRYDWPAVSFTLEDKGDYLALATQRLLVKVFKSPFRLEMYDRKGKLINRDSLEGGMGYRGEEVICRKERTDTDHFFGLGQRFEKSDLRGMKTICLVTREYTPVPFFMGSDGYGIFFHNFRVSEFDFTRDPYTFSAPGGGELDYYFIYGPGFKHILDQYTKITGKSPLPPKWAFGLYYSRWNEVSDGWEYRQGGQEGILRTMKAVREVWDWPLDGIRVCPFGPQQNFYASPKTAWPEAAWGAFPAVDQLVKQLHDLHIHPLFWETPGVHEGCAMYEEGAANQYFLTQEGKPVNVVFAFASPPGGLVDFLNPAARKWWGKNHHFMVDFGSDGIAGDWDSVNARGNLISPSTGMRADDFVNIYSLLFNQASWDAYKERNPNKRAIGFGLTYWAGGQRYPMQGTQDSHHEGKNIWGEMMGCINLGLSGIPFRIYTDNVSRSLLPSDPLSRLSQFLSVNIAGERTQIAVTGNPMADWNYRFYGKLRYRLMPYIYTYARETASTGIPLVRALVLEYQNDPRAYEAFAEYLLGPDILIAPLWSDSEVQREIYLPEGEWVDFFDGTTYAGHQTITYRAPLDRVPILIRKGAILVLAPEDQHYVDEKKSPFTIQIHPKGTGSFNLYEDDGESYDYEKGIFSVTNFSYRENANGLTVKKKPPEGKYRIPERDHIFCIHGQTDIQSVRQEGELLKSLRTDEELKSAAAGWRWDEIGKKLWIKAKGGANEAMSLQIVHSQSR
jgi:alpha-glucosidase (family GH31 glycosyl hydrolase)